jgi:hypothetical protein
VIFIRFFRQGVAMPASLGTVPDERNECLVETDRLSDESSESQPIL